MNPRTDRFLKSQDHCRLATIDDNGFPHCVPVGFWFSGSLIYIPTNSKSVKAWNLRRNKKCCVIVDVYKGGKGRGVMLQGTGKLAVGKEFLHAKNVVEQFMILFKPTKIIEIG